MIMLKKSLGAVGYLALAAFIAWALAVIAVNIMQSLGPDLVLLFLSTIMALWIILKISKR